MGDNDSEENLAKVQSLHTGGASPSSLASGFGIADSRVELIADYLLRQYRLKPDRWIKFYNNPDTVSQLGEFLSTTDKGDLLIFHVHGAHLEYSFGWPDNPQEKFTYFLKRKKGAKITRDNFRDEMYYGDFFPTMLDQMIIFVNKFVSNVVKNNEMSKEWPKVVTDDVRHHTYTLKTALSISSSRAKGHTLLLIPSEFDDFMYPDPKHVPDRKYIHEIESLIVMWQNEVEKILPVQATATGKDEKGGDVHYLPEVEIKYWIDRSKDFEQVYEQLIASKVKMMVKLLKDSGSVYYKLFKDLFSSVVAALQESKDNSMYMLGLNAGLEPLVTAEFPEANKHLGPLMHTVCLIWVHSKYYNTPERITVLLETLCNYVIDMVNSFLEPSEMFKGEIADTITNVKIAVSLMEHFRDMFDKHKAQIPTMYPKGADPKQWNFDPELVFGRYTKVLKRLKLAHYIMETNINFMKLEKVEFGGLKGNGLGEDVQNIFKEFEDSFLLFSEGKSNPLDTNDPGFIDSFNFFKKVMSDYDRRLATIVCHGFFDCTGLESIYKMINIMGPLLERELIMKDFDDKYTIIVKEMHEALDTCFDLYENQMIRKQNTGHMAVHKNMPPVAGAMQWAHEVYYRVSEHMENFHRIEHPIKHTETYHQVETRLAELKRLLDLSDKEEYRGWLSHVEKTCKDNMSKFLLIKDSDTGLLSVNLNPELIAVLKEMKYLKLWNQKNIPEMPETVFEMKDTLFKYYANLMLIMQLYNNLITESLPVEQPLIKEALSKIDFQLEPSITELQWKMTDIWEYISDTLAMITDLTDRWQQTKRNVQRIKTLLEPFAQTPLFERKEKQDNLLGLSDRVVVNKARTMTLTGIGMEIEGLMAANRDLFETDDSQEAWTTYRKYLDDIVRDCFIDIIGCTLRYLIDATTEDKTVGPLFDLPMELHIPNIVFNPELEPGSHPAFFDVWEQIFTDVYNQASLVPRLVDEEDNYQVLMNNSPELAILRDELIDNIDFASSLALAYRDSWGSYAHLWNDSRDDYLATFLKYNHILTAEEIAIAGDAGVEASPPTLDHFNERIEHYESLYDELDGQPAIQVFKKWLRIDSRNFKHSLLNEIKRWSHMFKQYLTDRVVNGLDDLEEFIKKTMKGLAVEPKENDYEGLVKALNLLNGVRERQAQTDAMFEPIKETIDLLKTHGVETTEKVYLQLENLPDQWVQLKKRVMVSKQGVIPLQQNQVAKIRRKNVSFDVKQHEYRERFRKCPAFFYNCQHPYRIMNKCHEEITALEKEQQKIQESCKVFDVHIPDYKQLKTCRFELRLLKCLWDYVFMVRLMFMNWKEILWTDIDVEQMDIDCKKLSKELRGLDKEMRAWDVYLGLEDELKKMITSLKAVGDLQNPAIRDRHWEELMEATQVTINMNEDTVLDDLLLLHLDEFEEDVRTIVDKASKETSMEKTLRDLNNTWANQEFIHNTHAATGITILTAEEELIEILEDNQVQLQNMMTSKFIAHFLDEVSDWQTKLSTTDQVISSYMGVQRTWLHLESIFIGSDDIRKQLPEDTARFERIDAEFKECAAEMSVTKNAVESCSIEGMPERLEKLQEELVVCEKALSEYLETKRLAFPRFYFVSSADLLDILSNSNKPDVVCKQLTKLFDSLANLQFDKSNPKVAHGMFAKDGEFVKLSQSVDLNGQVEIWLNRVLDAMRATVRTVMDQAVHCYEDKPREKWVFDWPAQMALVVTQIWWTTEVGQAFFKLEEGYEPALKDYLKKQIGQLNAMITLLVGELSGGDRQKLMTICTIDVHARDVVDKMIRLKVENSQCFQWLSQLRHRWDNKEADCFANICDAQFRYDKEYLGNTPRLVVTPLTDRCYITLTQSLHLIMGGAPAGPAGTGKTETTKDLGKSLGVMVYVFNCSEQMDYKSCGQIYMGLSQCGAWGCFDEFNRIAVEVLSVIAVQVKSIQDAIRDQKKKFNFMGTQIKLTPSVGIFITMNPGYAGRTELPENLKALFRPCAMVVPDFELICEIMLVAEGFLNARLLARKFITLYTLCRELLSKQDHYDWGLRAIKSVLVVAGALKRNDRNRPEDQVLMRALRDFNIPKIVADDMPVFMGLIGDLFPALDVPRKRDMDFEKVIKDATLQQKLQPEDNFILKVVQLQELFDVRHSVFILGAAGTGKSCVWNTLKITHRILGKKPVAVDLDPKSVTNDELFGVISPATREWKDGLFSVIMRDMAQLTGDGPKWIVLDGDIDPMWIESLNTVMDDNKILTLASNERISMTPQMRLLFEISGLRTATPATVSRAGILFINQNDIGWGPYIASWVDRRDNQTEKSNLTMLFDKYVGSILDSLRTRFKKITPITEIAHVQMLTYLLECVITPKNVPVDSSKDIYELYFVFCAVWAFGGCMFQDQLCDHRVDFTKWWIIEYKTIKFPSVGTVFDYYIDPVTHTFKPWTNIMPEFEFDPELPLQATMVDTAETTRLRYFLDALIPKRRPVMLVGGAGTGKTVLMQTKLKSLPEEYMIANVPFNFYTTSLMLQNILEKPLEKKAGKNYGPPGTKKLIYFVDDMNMPEVDKYFTVQPHTLVRACIDYGHWYDRQKLTLKEIQKTQFVSCMNPTAGSFTIDSRLQRHFCVFALSLPTKDALATIYSSILNGHMNLLNFNPACKRYCNTLVAGAIALQSKMTSNFLPTAIKFHYVFNLRDVSNIFQGMLFTTADSIKSPAQMVRLYFHEAERVYRDKLVDETDLGTYDKFQDEILKKNFEDQKPETINAKPLILCHFANGLGDGTYDFIPNWEKLHKLLSDALDQYNEVNSRMDLVLFEDAMCHVCKINRILESPRGNALLIGVGGSGKQSLSRLAAIISSLDVFQITLTKQYGIPELKLDLNALYRKTGLKGLGVMFLMSDSQVANEIFLVLINDLLASGEVADLFSDDDVEEILGAMLSECKQAGIPDTRENAWMLFIDKVRRNLKVVLCFSPVGSTLRVRSRKFPAVTNCTSIDWFHEWPEQALVSVSAKFLSDNELIDPGMRMSIAKFMAYAHSSVNEASQSYIQNEHRHNYTTPKSFLEQIALYQNLLTRKNDELQASIIRLENGLEKLRSTAQQVDDMKAKLASQEIELAAKNKDANELIAQVSVETEKVMKEKAIADVEEANVMAFSEEVEKKASDCQRDLAKAEPALLEAKNALATLNKGNLTELKSFGSPPAAVVNVTGAVMVLLAPNGNIPKDRSWKAAKGTTMSKVDQFLDNLINYDKDNIPQSCQTAIKPYLNDPEFQPDLIRSKSSAAAGLCSWVINIMKYYEVFCEVEPKRIALKKANTELSTAQHKLADVKAQVAQLVQALGLCQAELKQAMDTKQKCQDEADATAATIDLANRLVGGLASENVRWAAAIDNFHENEKTLPGDVLLITAYISYVGAFTKSYRVDLLDHKWLPFLKNLKQPIPVTPDLDPLTMLVDAAQVAMWNNESLPTDRMSTENATILTSCERWPLMIDPQLQGSKWIKTRHAGNLRVVRLGTQGYLEAIERAVECGEVLMLENIFESVDPVLDNILGRMTINKGRAIKIGDKEINYHPKFRLILQTKLANPHYKPEMQAQTTLINFTVTRDGLEDQLLGTVVSKERPDLEKLKSDLTRQQNEFKITLKDLEDNLLARLSTAEGNFLGDYALVENLEHTKRTAAEIEVKSAEAKITEVEINVAREIYRPVSARGSILFFIMNELFKINPLYQFSLKAFAVVFEKAIDNAEQRDTEDERVASLIDCITYSVYVYTTRGLFERDKIIFGTIMTLQILTQLKEVDLDSLDFLLRFPVTDSASPVDFLTNLGWGGIKALSDTDSFKNLDKDILGSAKRWKKFVEGEAPEKDKFPQEWKNKTPIEKLCMMRALRPDRMSNAITAFIEESMGHKYVENRAVEFAKSWEESGPATPIFFILSPGVDPLKDVEKHGKKLGYLMSKENFHNISLGQGQEIVAERAIDLAAKKGHWVVLQNVHLVAKWLPRLEKKIEQYSEEAHLNYRLYVSAEPAADRAYHIIPQSILEASIKITNEPPTGMQANLHKSLDNFNQDTLEMCSKEIEFKAILFALCYFHAVVCERRKFGAQGWNRVYPFNVGDLTISVNVLYNYLEANSKVPWEDLRYLFGDIMYGGHITDDWDRKLCRTYLEVFMNQDMIDSTLDLAPGFPVPPGSDYEAYHAYIDDELPPETPYLYGLHPNAEIEFLTKRSDNLLQTVFAMQPRDAGAATGEVVSREERIKEILDDLTERLPESFNLEEIMSKVPPDDRTPYVVVAFQETERMNFLLDEIRLSLKELDLGLKGELTITGDMEDLSNSLFMNILPERWIKKAYPSLFMLAQWYGDMLARCKELDAWVADFQLPVCVWLGGFFNPQSFITAIMQQMSRKNEWPLDRMTIQCDVTKKNKEEMTAPPREGAYVYGLYMEGARWDSQTGFIGESFLKDLTPRLPVIFLKAIPVDRMDQRVVYECPVYKTKSRGPTFVWTFRLKSKCDPAKWVLAGVALLLQV